MHQDNRTDFRLKTVDEPHSVVQWIGGGGVRRHLINELSELGDIGRHSGSLFNQKELVDEDFMLITVKSVMKEFAKFGLGTMGNSGLN